MAKGRNTTQGPRVVRGVTGRNERQGDRGEGPGQGGKRRDRQQGRGSLTCCAETLQSHKCPGAQGLWYSASWGSQHPRTSHSTESMGLHVCQSPAPSSRSSWTAPLLPWEQPGLCSYLGGQRSIDLPDQPGKSATVHGLCKSISCVRSLFQVQWAQELQTWHGTGRCMLETPSQAPSLRVHQLMPILPSSCGMAGGGGRTREGHSGHTRGKVV